MKWPADKQDALTAFYGKPGADIERQMVDVKPPWQMYYDGKKITRIRIHKKCAPYLAAALAEIWERAKHDQKLIEKHGMHVFGGCYNPRYVRGTENTTKKLSIHAFAAAVDFDPAHNGLNQKGRMHPVVVEAFKKQGARWGGNFSRLDPMHFEFAGGGNIPELIT